MRPTPILCYVTDRAALPAPENDALLSVIRRAIAAGVDWIQVREKNLSGRALAALAHDAVAATRSSSTRIVINGRLDVALAARANVVHLGGDALPVADVASWCAQHASEITSPFLLGASCHSLADAQAAERDGANYISFGSVFATPSKLRYGPAQGVARLQEGVQILLGIGLLRPDEIRQVFEREDFPSVLLAQPGATPGADAEPGTDTDAEAAPEPGHVEHHEQDEDDVEHGGEGERRGGAPGGGVQ